MTSDYDYDRINLEKKESTSIIIEIIQTNRMRNFRNYDVWTDGVDFSVDIYKITENFPKKETYALCDQMQRAAVSIPSNIAEGCSRRSVNEFAHFLEFSLGSSYEIETQLEIAVRLGYVNNDDFVKAIEKVQSIEKRVTGLIQTIRANSNNEL